MIPAYLLEEAAQTTLPRLASVAPRLAALGGLLSKVPAALGKIPLSVLFGGSYLGAEGLKQIGGIGERGVAREQLAAQVSAAKAKAEAEKKLTLESRKETKRLTKEQLKFMKEQAKNEREMEMMRLFTESQNRQMAMVMAAIQASNQRPSQAMSPRAGMLNLMRTGF